MKKKSQGVGSILRKREEKERCSYMSWNDTFKSSNKPTHIIKKIKDVDGSIIGYIECMEEDMLRAEKASKEIRTQIKDAIAKARGEVASETDNTVPVFLDKNRENHLKNLRKKANVILVENAFIKRVNNLSTLMTEEGFTPEVYSEEKDKIEKLMDKLSPEFIKNDEEVIKHVKTMFENTDKSLKEYKGEQI